MKKAFDANVSRARPRLRLGMLGTEETTVSAATVESLAQAVAHEPVIPSREESVDLSQALKARQSARATRGTAAEVLTTALEGVDETVAHDARRFESHDLPTEARRSETQHQPAEVRRPTEAQQAPEARRPMTPQHVSAATEAPEEVREVQNAPLDVPMPDSADRREKLRERLKAVRENPRPEPLPETVAEAGVLAVERIAALQSELSKTRAVNLALSQDLEAARRQAERATEEARLRMDEARRLSSEMEGRVQLLADLERELSALEGERNDALLALQESRQANEFTEREKLELRESISARDRDLEASLEEEERLASELESTHEAMAALRRSADVLKTERDTFARQVADLTKERAELLEARKALEAVHRALSKASALA